MWDPELATPGNPNPVGSPGHAMEQTRLDILGRDPRMKRSLNFLQYYAVTLCHMPVSEVLLILYWEAKAQEAKGPWWRRFW